MDSQIDTESQKSSAPKRSHRTLLLSVLAVIVVIALGVGIYYIVSDFNGSTKHAEIEEEVSPETEKWVNNEEIKIFRKYLRFPTVSLDSDFGPCVNFLKELANDLDLEVSVLYPVNDKNPVVIMTWKGSQPELPSILLNSHIDVVPVAVEFWTYPPFSAKIDESGNIYARGAQDMKPVGMQYLGAIRALKRKGINQLKRTIHLTYVPDEETGGEFGMAPFVQSDRFKKLNIGVALDEGYPSENENLEVFFAEKPDWAVTVTSNGHSGHASILFDDTAGEKLNYVISKFMELRKNEKTKWKEHKYPYGNVTSINLTILNGGLRGNIVPPQMTAYFDLRLAIDTDWDQLEQMIRGWVKEAGNDVTVDIVKGVKAPATPVDDSNPYWTAFKKATDELKLNVTPTVFRAVTDSRYIRMGLPVLGFSPLMNTSPKLHEHNEYVNAEAYLKGIPIYEKIIEKIANV
ncbi:aminoacylase-1-like isoform X2 [Sitodiplosis mosellana]|uniref:aminoacylase-1-like isoform X2 n=1 Tax=Sitodiplosis mosellana TaxID=263140 RepID=UPI0024448B7C|nr:aminoacylase-1-like isoform X2 [Sitodiplosis mosellana]